jgi:hypothetical protein
MSTGLCRPPTRGGTPFAIDSWVPPAAAAVIELRSTMPRLPARDLALLKRLATAPAMRDVWKKTNAVDAGKIVNMILFAEAAASDMRPPLPKRTKDLPAHFEEFPHFPSLRDVALAIEHAVQNMRQCEAEACVLWTHL